MKIIKTKISNHANVVISNTLDSDSVDTNGMGNAESDQFTSIMLTTDGFKAILENARVPDELLQILIDRYNIVPQDKGVASGVVGSWLAEQLASFTELQLQQLTDGLDVHGVANFIAEAKIDGMRIRSGYLSSRHYIPLIGESKHAIVKKSRN